MITAAGIAGAVVLAALVAVSAYDAFARPGLRRLAMRNVRRRWSEALLVVVGSSLGTATIVASLLVGATFHASARDGARTGLGPIDEVVTVADVARLGAVAEVLARPPLPGVDGLLRAVTSPAALTSDGGARGGKAPAAVPDALMAEVDMAEARRFGADPAATGLSAVEATPAPGAVVLNAPTADDLGVRAGDRISLHAFGSTLELRVDAVVPQVGLAGFADAYVAPGTLEGLSSGRELVRAAPPVGKVLVSNDGGVFDSAGRSATVTAELRGRTSRLPGVDVSSDKHDLLRDADAQGRSVGQLFVGVGTFSVLAAVLLLINLVVMLAEERRRELGLARAVGLRRSHVTRTFAMEGTVYAVAAAAVGAVAGEGVGWLIVAATRRLLGSGGGDAPVHLRFAAPIGDIAVGAAIGFGVALVTVWATSFRIANLTIVRALRDLPAPPRRGHHLPSVGVGVAAILGGGALFGWGLVVSDPAAVLVGPTLALVGALPLLVPVLGRRTAVGGTASLALVWCAGVFAFLPDVGKGVPVPVFVIQGVLLVAAAVALATAVDHFWVTLVDRISRTGRGLSARLGLAYPLARLARTSMLLATYALVIFTLSFLAIYGRIFGSQAAQFSDDLRAGTDLLVDANPANPVSVEQITAQRGVASAAALWRSGPDFTADFQRAPRQWALTGFDRSLLSAGTPALSERASRFRSDRAVFEAMLTDPSLIVVDEQFLAMGSSNQPGDNRVKVGDVVFALNPSTGERHAFRVVGLMAHDAVRAGAFASTPAVRDLMGVLAAQSRFYVKVSPGTAPQAVADRLDTTFVDRGVDARTFRSVVDDTIAVELGFFRLMEGYLLLGLVIGTAGVGVVMVRAVRERRRQIGMLRAMGFPIDVVRRAFAVEAAFIALQGAVMGVALGIVISYQMLTRSAALGGRPLPYSVPWGALVVLGLLPLVTSLVAVIIPAGQAARIRPAVALYRAD